MEAFVSLAHGLTVAIQPMNLLFALIGVLLGTAVGVLPGIGPALTVALLLPITFKLDPGRLDHHVRRHLLRRHVWRLDHRDPDQHARRKRLDGDRARRQQDGQGRAAAARRLPPPPSAPSSPAPSRRSASTFLAPSLVDIAVQFGPEDYFALMCVAFVTVSATFGDSPVRGLTSLFIGLAAGPRRHRHPDRPVPPQPSAFRNCSTASR